MNEQEQAIAKIQQMLNYCVQETFRSLEETIERKAEVLTDEEMTEIERSEYTHALDELAAIYAKCPAVRSIKRYMHLPDFLWESTFLESLTMNEKRKWFHSHCLASYDDFCKDHTIFDEDFPYFSYLYDVVVNERYLQYLKERSDQRLLRSISSAKEEKEIVTPQHEGNESSTPAIGSTDERYTFEYTLTDQQIEHLVDCVNEVRMFKGGEVSFEQLKSIFDCQPITPLRSSNNRLIAFFFDQLASRYYIVDRWQSVIARNKLFLSPQKDTYLNQHDISTAVNHVKDFHVQGKLAKIAHYIKHLKALDE